MDNKKTLIAIFSISLLFIMSSCSDYVDIHVIENKNGILTKGDWVQKTNIPSSVKEVIVDEQYGDYELTTNFIILKAKKINEYEINGSECGGCYYKRGTYSNNKYYFIAQGDRISKTDEKVYELPSEAVFLVSKEKIYSHENNKRIFVKKVKHLYF